MDPAHVLAGAKVTALLSGQRGDGGFGVHPYRKWTGAHWRLVSLAELVSRPGGRARPLRPTRCLPGWSARAGAFA
jgi:hypothetical protein